jgi:hypothetical protein
MSSPHINGVVALMREVAPDLPVDEIKQVIYDTAFDLGSAGEDNTYGWGMVDAFEAINNIQGFGMTTTSPVQVICAPANASYPLDFRSFQGFNEPITLTAAGAPPGANLAFSPNPVTPPGAATMTISNTAGAVPGVYDITITATAASASRDLPVTLSLSDATPPVATLTTPANGATSVARRPTLGWSAAAQAWRYEVELSDTPGFGNIIFSGETGETSIDVNVQLGSLATYYWRVRVSNGCGTGAFSAPFEFETLDQPDYFTEEFDSGNNDLDNFFVQFTPDGTGEFYDACGGPATVLPTDPTGGAVLPLSDDDAEPINPSQAVSLYGASYTTVYVGSNGYLTFLGPDTDFTESLSDHFEQPRVSGLFDDLNPASGGQVSWKETVDRVAVSYIDVPEFSNTGSNTFQIEMFFDGTIRITWLDIGAADGITGLSEGNGVPNDFVESDTTANGPCLAPCPADVNGDRSVDVLDLLEVLANWGPCPGCPADVNGDTVVDVLDLLEVLANWGACP